jgi:hypothetical protein
MNTQTQLYLQYEYLADIYANKLFNYHKIGFEKQDVVQELKIKIFTSIESHCIRTYEWKEEGAPKPIPLEFYIKLALNNKIKDFIALIDKEKLFLELDGSFDFGKRDSSLNIEEGKWELNGVNLVEGLDRKQKVVFVSYLKGVPMSELKKKFSRICNVNKTIKTQIEVLRKSVSAESEDLFYNFSSNIDEN